jgi:hypothetical protein
MMNAAPASASDRTPSATPAVLSAPALRDQA